jgi:hypothetical protein
MNFGSWKNKQEGDNNEENEERHGIENEKEYGIDVRSWARSRMVVEHDTDEGVVKMDTNM